MEDLGLDERIIFKLILKASLVREWAGLTCLGIRDKWRAVVDAVMNLWVL